MVTILDPRETVPVEPTLPRKESQLRRERGFLAYSVPFPGVKYYAFEPGSRSGIPMPDVNLVRPTLTATLIDERVILL